ncbi:MAG: nuclear transport factor 2 family protein [Paraglaciecola sp.]|nr:nuclear transport factor 2 family protein [Paraglaciecola sp.]
MFKTRFIKMVVGTCLVLVGTQFYAGASETTADDSKINSVLDDLHDAASKAQKERYLALFTEDGVFMGTDDWERWTRPDEFDAYVETGFNKGGWTYFPVERHIQYAPDGNTAWFDEITESPKWGRFRGTGVLIRHADNWKVAHYALSFLVPNEAWEQVSKMSTKAFETRKNK